MDAADRERRAITRGENFAASRDSVAMSRWSYWPCETSTASMAQRLEGDAGLVDALRPGERKRRGALRPHRIHQDVEAGGLDQPAHTAMKDSRTCPPFTCGGGVSACGFGT